MSFKSVELYDHHDDAYRWTERRKLERHPTTGAMQLVEVRERVEEVVAPTLKAVSQTAKPKLFDNLRKFELMAFGVPAEWVDDVRAADEDTLFDVIAHLPQEAQEALLKLAVGEKPEAPKPMPAETDPFAHPDALRRFRILGDVEALRRALDEPWTSLGRNGRSSSTRHKPRSWFAISLGRRGFPDRREQARQLWRFIARFTSHARTRRQESC